MHMKRLEEFASENIYLSAIGIVNEEFKNGSVFRSLSSSCQKSVRVVFLKNTSRLFSLMVNLRTSLQIEFIVESMKRHKTVKNVRRSLFV